MVFASGSGSNFQAIIDALHKPESDALVAGLVASRTGIKSIDRAEKAGIPVFIFDGDDETLIEQLKVWETDLIALAGFMKKISSQLVQKYPNRILNIHPALLPKYGGKGLYGLKVHQAVIANKEKESGCTVHYVNEEYDEGPIIEQMIVPVHEDDTPEELAARVLEKEHQLYPKVISTLIKEIN